MQAFADVSGDDGRVVRASPVPSHSGVLTAHERGVLVLRQAGNLTVVPARVAVGESSDHTADLTIFDMVVSHDESWVVVSAGTPGGPCKAMRFSLPSLAFLDNVSSSSLPAKALAVSPDDTLIAVGSDDHKLLVVRVADITQCWVLHGCKAALKCVSVRVGVAAASTFLVGASTCDGNVRVWRVAVDADPCTVSPLCCRECMPSDKRGEGGHLHPRNDVVWIPRGPTSPPALAVPADNKVLLLTPSDTDMGRKAYLQAWKVVPATHDQVVIPLAACCTSPDGEWLVTADTAGKVMLWSVDAADHMYHARKSGDAGKGVSHMSWRGDVLSLVSVDGGACVWEPLALREYEAPAKLDLDAIAAAAAANPTGPATASFSDSSEDEEEVEKARVKKKATRPPPARRTRVLDEDDEDGHSDDGDDDAKPSKTTDVSAYFDDAADESDADVEPPPSKHAHAGPKPPSDAPLPPSNTLDPATRAMVALRELEDLRSTGGDGDEDGEDGMDGGRLVAAGAPAQEPFQPGSTSRPSLSDSGTHRHFLVWNRVGSVVCRLDTDDDGLPTNGIDIEFADVSRMRNVKFTEQFDFTMAALGLSGALFANQRVLEARRAGELLADLQAAADAEAEGNGGAPKDSPAAAAGLKGKPCTVVYRGISGLLPTTWQETLPLEEDAVAVAVGSHWAAVATTRQWLRVFQLGGTQGSVLATPGPVVSMVGEGPLCGVLYHRSPPVGNRQLMSVCIWNVGRDGTAYPVACADVPLGEDTSVSWIGFTTHHTFTLLDSNGVLFALTHGPMGSVYWRPVLDTAAHPLVAKKDLTAWMIGVDGDKALCVLCKSSTPEPRAMPKPVQTTLSLSTPLLGRAANGPRVDQEDVFLQRTSAVQHWRWCMDAGIDLWTDDCPERLGDQGSLATPAGLEASHAAVTSAITDVDKTLLRLFQSACKDEKDSRALDIAERLHSAKSVEIAMKVAQQLRRNALAQLLYRSKDRLGSAGSRLSALPANSGFHDEPALADGAVGHREAPPARSLAAPSTARAELPSDPMTSSLQRRMGTKADAMPAPSTPAGVGTALPPKHDSGRAKLPPPPSPPRPTPDGTAAKNPFAKAVVSSPSKRPRNLYETLATTASPQSKKQQGLQRQSSFAVDARTKRHQEFIHQQE